MSPIASDSPDDDRGLDPGAQEPANIADLMRPFPADRMAAWPVGQAVGSVKNDGPGLIEPVPPPEPQGGLFNAG